MPVIYLNIERLNNLVGEKLTYEKLDNLLFSLKSESKVLDGSRVEVEVNSDRPDLFVSEGMARALKGLLEIEEGLFQPKTKESEYSARIFEVLSRPYIAVGVLKGIELGEEGLKELIQFQEKLHITVGRKRKKVAIGIHDLRKIPDKKLEYTMISLDMEMIPLGSKTKMKIKDVLKETEQGRSYGEISVLGGAHPAIISGGEIISLPPVINSEITRVEPDSRELLIDVTGTDRDSVIKTLDLICSLLNEHKNSIIEKVKIIEQPTEVIRQDPPLARSEVSLQKNYVKKILGFDIRNEDIVHHLLRMRFGISKEKDDSLDAIIPEYRVDIMHPIDLVEEIAMAYGYNRIPVKILSLKTEGSLDHLSTISRAIRLLLIGLAFQEIQSFVMMGTHAELFRTGNQKLLKIKNPVSEEMGWVRPNLASSLLTFLIENQHAELPLKIFEIGDYAYQIGEKITQKKSVALAIMKDELSFEEIQAPLYSLLSSLGLEVKFRRDSISYLLEGRAAKVIVNDIPIGIVGEVHPYVLTSMGIKYPVGIAELDLDTLSNIIARKQSSS
ncbi:MAG: phenylalanine--tRNA ligase subunit beta [Fervidicoccaceae archaeon]